MYCFQRSQYIRLNSKKNSFRGNYSRKYGICLIFLKSRYLIEKRSNIQFFFLRDQIDDTDVSDTSSLHKFFEKISHIFEITKYTMSNTIRRFFSNFVTFSENMNYKPSKKNLPLGWDKVEEVIGGGGGCCIRCPAEGC